MKTKTSLNRTLFYVLGKDTNLDRVDLDEIAGWNIGHEKEEEAFEEVKNLINETKKEKEDKKITCSDLKIVKVSYSLEEIQLPKNLK